METHFHLFQYSKAVFGLGLFTGHTWQIALGGALLGTGTVGSVALIGYIHILRGKDNAMQALKNDEKTRIWTFANENGQKVMLAKGSDGNVHRMQLSKDNEKNLQNSYQRVVVPFFSKAVAELV